jgi:hypothetical protein
MEKVKEPSLDLILQLEEEERKKRRKELLKKIVIGFLVFVW